MCTSMLLESAHDNLSVLGAKIGIKLMHQYKYYFAKIICSAEHIKFHREFFRPFFFPVIRLPKERKNK